MTSIKVAILLSTYNGEKYLAALLDSLLRQSFQEFVIVVRDDGSHDGTLKILEAKAAANPKKFHLLDVEKENLGASQSFARLIQYVLENKELLSLSHVHMAFADQDDIWHSDKLKKTLKALEQHQEINGEKPTLIHSDLRVVADDGKLVNTSLASFQGLQQHRNSFHQLVLSNLVTGCTALINEPLARLALPISDDCIMHDWWLCLVASAFGEVHYLPQSLIDYRQHEGNTIGAKKHKVATGNWLQRKVWVLNKLLSVTPNSHLHEVAKQAVAFKSVYRDQLDEAQLSALDLAAKLSSNSLMVQRLVCRKLRELEN